MVDTLALSDTLQCTAARCGLETSYTASAVSVALVSFNKT